MMILLIASECNRFHWYFKYIIIKSSCQEEIMNTFMMGLDGRKLVTSPTPLYCITPYGLNISSWPFYEYFPYSCSVSHMAIKFSGGTSLCTLWTGLKIKPPPEARSSIRRFTSSFTCSGVPNGNIRWVSTLPPQNVRPWPNSRFNTYVSISFAFTWTGFRISTPSSINSGMSGFTAPHVW